MPSYEQPTSETVGLLVNLSATPARAPDVQLRFTQYPSQNRPSQLAADQRVRPDPQTCWSHDVLRIAVACGLFS